MPILPDIFTRSISVPKIKADNQNNSKFWLKMDKNIENKSIPTYFFIIKKLTEEESEKVTKSLDYPHMFYFVNYGNVQGSIDGTDEGIFKIFNPLRTSDVTTSADPLEKRVSAHKNQFSFDHEHVITENLKYILHKKDKTWYLLYNPIHREEFKNYWKRVLADSSITTNWAGTYDDAKYINTTTLFREYCKSLIINKDRDFPKENTFLDPTCNMILSPERCANNAFFQINLSTYPKYNKALQPVLDQLQTKQSGIEPCLATGTPSDFMNDSPLNPKGNSSSFTSAFRERDTFSQSMTFTVCNTEITSSGDANLEGVNIENSCGGGGKGDASVSSESIVENEEEEKDEETNTTLPAKEETNTTLPAKKETNTTLPAKKEPNTTLPTKKETNTTLPTKKETNVDYVQKMKENPMIVAGVAVVVVVLLLLLVSSSSKPAFQQVPNSYGNPYPGYYNQQPPVAYAQGY